MAELNSTKGISVEPGKEVMSKGRVLDLDLATISFGCHSVRLVDAVQPKAEALAKALETEGHKVLKVKPDESGLIERILATLEE